MTVQFIIICCLPPQFAVLQITRYQLVNAVLDCVVYEGQCDIALFWREVILQNLRSFGNVMKSESLEANNTDLNNRIYKLIHGCKTCKHGNLPEITNVQLLQNYFFCTIINLYKLVFEILKFTPLIDVNCKVLTFQIHLFSLCSITTDIFNFLMMIGRHFSNPMSN